MSNIGKAFDGKKAFISFITCGDPSLEETRKQVYTLVEAGVDLIELGIPFSDPTAEGPVIQEANERALAGGITTDRIFEFVKELRRDNERPVTIPLVFMTYANVVYSYRAVKGLEADGRVINGSEAFFFRCREAGIDGVILSDVPYEEKEEFQTVADLYGVDMISLIAPTSAGRITEIAANAKGFIYIVSSLGVTGVRNEITTDIGSIVQMIREVSDVPCVVGFGISTADQARKMAGLSDGAIIGSGIMKKFRETGITEASAYITDLAEAVHDAI